MFGVIVVGLCVVGLLVVLAALVVALALLAALQAWVPLLVLAAALVVLAAEEDEPLCLWRVLVRRSPRGARHQLGHWSVLHVYEPPL